MSHIDDLIAEHCPNGVEYKTLGEVGEFIRGNGLQKSDLTDAGVGAIHYGQIHTHYGTWATETKSFVSEAFAAKLRKARPGDLVIVTTSEDDEAVAKAVAWIGEAEVAISGDAYIYRHQLEPKYAAYFFQSEHFQDQKKRYINGTKVRRVSGESLAKIRIPVPPLEIQREIVKVLDTFTTLEAELEVELKAELEARRQQYKYYRDALLTFDEDINRAGEQASRRARITHLSEICKQTSNIKWQESDRTYRYIDLTSVNREDHTIKETAQINAENAPSRAQKIVEEDDVLFATTRPTLQRFAIVDADHAGEVASTGYCILRADKNKVLPKWIYFNIFTTAFYDYVERNQEGSAYPAISDAKVKAFELPLPSLEEQERIVGILDRFDALVNDLSSGLPAEIKARRQQYEYYRNRLLTFKEIA